MANNQMLLILVVADYYSNTMAIACARRRGRHPYNIISLLSLA